MTAAGDECSVGAVFEQPSEHVVYRDAYGVTVTTARIVSNSATYPLAAVTGVQCSEEPRPYGAAVGVGAVVFIGALIGCAVCELGQASFFVAGLVAGAVGRFVVTGTPKRYRVRIFTASGPFDVVSTADRAHGDALTAAIGQAAAARG